MARKMKCSGKGKVRTCSAGGKSFKLRNLGRKRVKGKLVPARADRPNPTWLREFRFTKADARKCKGKKRGEFARCVTRQRDGRIQVL